MLYIDYEFYNHLPESAIKYYKTWHDVLTFPEHHYQVKVKSDNELIPSFYRRYVNDTLAIMPGLDAAESFRDVLNGLHCIIHFTMELSNHHSIPFIGTLITKNGNKLETQVYRKPTNMGLLLHFQSHTDLRYKKCLIKTMVHRAKELSSTHQAFVDEYRHLKSMFHHLGYPSSLVNCIIDKCDYSSTLDAKANLMKL